MHHHMYSDCWLCSKPTWLDDSWVPSNHVHHLDSYRFVVTCRIACVCSRCKHSVLLTAESLGWVAGCCTIHLTHQPESVLSFHPSNQLVISPSFSSTQQA
jgi:hypothetical protein